tara:strand:- start:274 stop:612 length:339 start_codon:yes stop_codon:yes gene_type:complete
MPPELSDKALCAQACADGWANPDDWFPENHQLAAQPAKGICANCEVQAECQAYANLLETVDMPIVGVWAGAYRAWPRGRSAAKAEALEGPPLATEIPGAEFLEAMRAGGVPL